jgi:hypothetical protein
MKGARATTAEFITKLTTSVIPAALQEHFLNHVGEYSNEQLEEMTAILDQIQRGERNLKHQLAKVKKFYARLESNVRQGMLREIEQIERELEEELADLK